MSVSSPTVSCPWRVPAQGLWLKGDIEDSISLRNAIARQQSYHQVREVEGVEERKRSVF